MLQAAQDGRKDGRNGEVLKTKTKIKRVDGTENRVLDGIVGLINLTL